MHILFLQYKLQLLNEDIYIVYLEFSMHCISIFKFLLPTRNYLLSNLSTNYSIINLKYELMNFKELYTVETKYHP